MCEFDTTEPIGNMRNDQIIALVMIIQKELAVSTFNWLADRLVN